MNIDTIDNIVPELVLDNKGGLFNYNKAVRIWMSEAGTIYYTRNGSTPTTSSAKYAGPIVITSTTTLKFIAVDLAGNLSPVYTQKYTIDKTVPRLISTYPKICYWIQERVLLPLNSVKTSKQVLTGQKS